MSLYLSFCLFKLVAHRILLLLYMRLCKTHCLKSRNDFLCCVTKSIISNAVVRYVQCKCLWPVSSQTFLLGGRCVLLFSINILELACFWNEYLAIFVRTANFWQPAFLPLIRTDGFKCHVRFRPSNFLQSYEIWQSFRNLYNILQWSK